MINVTEQEGTPAPAELHDMPERTRVAIYCRVSTDEQSRTGISLKMQEERLRAYAKLRGWHVAKVYVDAGTSAKTLRRDELEELRKDAKAKRFDGVLVFKIDRLSRNLYDLLTLIREFQKRRIALVSFSESFDTDTPMGAAMVQMLGTFAEFEQKQVSARTRDAIARLREEGRVYGPTPYGFTRADGNLKPNHHQLSVVRRIFHLRGQGRSLRQIADELNNARFRTQKGKRWAFKQVHYILNNTSLYGGYVGAAKREEESGHRE